MTKKDMSNCSIKKGSERELSLFEKLEASRYEKLRNAPDNGPFIYPDLKDGSTMKEILGIA